jgi:hypothetical protein
MVRLVLVGPILTTTAVLTRSETRDVARHLIEASHTITDEMS